MIDLDFSAGALVVGYRVEWSVVPFIPATRLAWGVLLIVAGFVALSLGVWLNWSFRGREKRPGPSAES